MKKKSVKFLHSYNWEVYWNLKELKEEDRRVIEGCEEDEKRRMGKRRKKMKNVN